MEPTNMSLSTYEGPTQPIRILPRMFNKR